MQTLQLTSEPAGLQRAVALLSTGQVGGVPTETVYGLAGNALDEGALLKIFEAKERPLFDPLIVHVAETGWERERPIAVLERLEQAGWICLEGLSTGVRESLCKLIQAFWPGPLTLVLPRGSKIPDLATSGLPYVGIRMPAHPAMQALLKNLDFPLAAPSANRFGRISPTCAEAVSKELDGRIAFILDGGECREGIESTILGIAVGENQFQVLRPGSLSLAEIAAKIPLDLGQAARSPVVAPGQLPSHYAPRKSCALLTSGLPMTQQKGIGWLRFVQRGDEAALQEKAGFTAQKILYLSEDGTTESAAKRLFASLRALDEAPEVSEIWIESVPENLREARSKGLGFAIQDRLIRATAKKEA